MIGVSVAAVIYKPVVCGKTFNADKQLMDSVRGGVQDRAQITEWNPDLPDHQVNIIFCPVSSRAGTDAAEALTHATGMFSYSALIM